MHNVKSKKLPIIGRNHSYRIIELVDTEHHRNNAKDHYESVKTKQLIVDYNIAVDNLNDLYDTVMNAQEIEAQLKEELDTVQGTLKNLKEQMQKAHDKMLLSKARLQHVGISTKDLNKLKPVSQGTQSIDSELKPVQTGAGIVEIPDDEDDVAVKNLIKSTKVQIPETEKPEESAIPPLLIQKTQPKKPFTLVNPTGGETYQIIDLDEPNVQQSDVAVSQKVSSVGGMPFHILTPQNIANFTATTQNVPGTSQSMLNFTATPQNVAGASQNVVITGQSTAITGQSAAITGQSTVNPPQNVSSAGFIIPDGFKNTKYDDTLEKIDLSSSESQKHVFLFQWFTKITITIF